MSALSWGAAEPHLPILLVIVPILGALVTTFLRNSFLAWLVALVVSVTLPFMAIQLLVTVLETGQPITYMIGNWEAPFGIVYKVDQLSGYILTVISLIGAVIMPFARRSVIAEIDERAR